MLRINIEKLDKFKKVDNEYRYYLQGGLYLKFNDNLEFDSLQSYYSVSNKDYNKIESKLLARLYSEELLVYEK